MGNYRFRLSDLIPNSWFHKLKDSTKTRKNQHKQNPTSVSDPGTNLSDHRKSYHFTRDLNLTSNSPVKPRISDKKHHSPVESPRKSSGRRRRRRRSTKKDRSPKRSVESAWIKPPGESLNQTSTSDYDSISPEYGSDHGLTPDTFDGMLSCSTSCRCSVDSEQDHLPPIITKKLQEPAKILTAPADFPARNAYGSLSVKVSHKFEPPLNATASTISSSKRITSPNGRYSPKALSPGLRLRTNSPRIGNRRIQGRKNGTTVCSNSSSGSRRSVSESFAVVKSSKDPRRDFRESMVEMIVENNIRGSRDLEELLACYLTLNSDEYHDTIINVFKQIWFEFLK